MERLRKIRELRGALDSDVDELYPTQHHQRNLKVNLLHVSRPVFEFRF